MRNFSGKICTENQDTHFMFNNVFLKIVPFMRQCKKHIGAGEAADDNMGQAHITLST
jgi:uncharacterized membrane protein